MEGAQEVSAVRQSVASLLARRGISADAEAPPEEPFDPVVWRVETYTAILEREVPLEFAHALPDHPEVAEWVRSHVEDPARLPLLLIAGRVGVGKTHQAYGALRQCAIGTAQANRRCRWRFVTHPQLNDQTRPKPDQSHAYALDPYLEADLLVLDDLGAGKQSEWTGDALCRLVDHRWSSRLPTIFTTNVAPSQLTTAVDERVVSRLATATFVFIAGPDRRRITSGGPQ